MQSLEISLWTKALVFIGNFEIPMTKLPEVVIWSNQIFVRAANEIDGPSKREYVEADSYFLTQYNRIERKD